MQIFRSESESQWTDSKPVNTLFRTSSSDSQTRDYQHMILGRFTRAAPEFSLAFRFRRVFLGILFVQDSGIVVGGIQEMICHEFSYKSYQN